MPIRSISRALNYIIRSAKENLMSIKIVLAVNNEYVRKCYLKEFKKNKVQIDTVASLDELYKVLTKTAYNGIMLDVPTRIMATADERILVQEAMGTYPVCVCNLDQDSGEIRVILNDEQHAKDKFDYFINQQCAHFSARKIRKSSRFAHPLKALLLTASGQPEKGVAKTITVNVSNNGVFLFGVEDKKIGDTITFLIKDLDDKTPISGVVRWVTQWESSSRIPGYGIEFSRITAGQAQQISNLILEKKSRSAR
jgi:Tfp pilus assembly protein PilZ